ncbi:MAG: hypothetical protein N3D73_01050 [Candidatus Diapherotrites archaeon]|nr:hypothetical protein [Candidatus Diapherotrites archaeon]
MEILLIDLNATSQNIVNSLTNNINLLIIGILLIIIAIILIAYLKEIVINSILGLICWLILYFVFKIELQLIPTLVISIIFGLAGIGTILILKFFGIPV